MPATPFHVLGMERATKPLLKTDKDPLDTGTEAHRPAKNSANDQACGANRSRSELNETERPGEEDRRSVSTRPPGGGDGRDDEAYWNARKLSCRANRKRMGGAHLGLVIREAEDGQHQREDQRSGEDEERIAHSRPLPQEIADARARTHIGNAEEVYRDVLDAQPLQMKVASVLKALVLAILPCDGEAKAFEAVGLPRLYGGHAETAGHAVTRVLGVGAR